MIVATFNVNSVRSRLDIVCNWLTKNKPDVLCLQETKVVDADFPEQPFNALGYHAVYRGEKSYNGVAILSQKPPDQCSFGLDDGGPADEPRMAYARFGKLHVVNTYVPQGREIDHAMYQYKLEWLKRLKQYFSRHFKPSDLLLWTGDLNVAPDFPDIHNAEKQLQHVCFHEAVRKQFADTVAWGFTDLFRNFHPEPGQYTFFDYRTPNAVKRGMGWRIDHIMVTKPLCKKALNCWIDIEPRLMEKPSDHTILAAEFDKC